MSGPGCRSRSSLKAVLASGVVWIAGSSFAAAVAPVDATALPLGLKTVAASVQECAVWRRERSFAHSVEAHDAVAFASHVHPGAVFDAGGPDAVRGREAITAGWAAVLEGKTLVLRWRPGIVDIGGDPTIALSRGPYILQTDRDGKVTFRVGFYQTVWLREAIDTTWRVLFDGAASTPIPVADRAAAEAWVVQQDMSDCASS